MADADLVLEGGGVKGAALVGALKAMVDRPDPYTFRRVAGTSAGAIVASLVAAGYSVPELTCIMTDLDFSRFEDQSWFFRHLRWAGQAYGILFHEGMFLGDALHEWIATTLAAKGIRTWADLKEDDPGSALPPERRYKLVVIVSDVSRGRMLRLPWDYEELLGVDPDGQLVADAVRSSAGIPFFFRPFRMAAGPTVSQKHGAILSVDGGMLSNFPVDIFDRQLYEPGGEPRWPTLGVKLSARRPIQDAGWRPNRNAIGLATSLLSTMASAHDTVHVDDPEFSSRTVFIDTTGVSSTDFHLGDQQKSMLLANGVAAGQKFLSRWSWDEWRSQPRPLPYGWECTGQRAAVPAPATPSDPAPAPVSPEP